MHEGPATPAASGVSLDLDSPKRSITVWVAAACLLTICGVVVSLLTAAAGARAVEETSRNAFEQDSRQVAAALQLAIRHEEDLAVFAGGFLLANPDASATEFDRWVADVGMLTRYPEVSGLAVIVGVPAANLPAFVARSEADGSGPFVIQPAGQRPFYCFTSLSAARTAAMTTPAGTDICAGHGGSQLLAGRDSGQGSYAPYLPPGGQSLLAIQTPLYAGGQVPTTVPARQAALVGWIAMTVDPAVLLQQAQHGYPDVAVSMRYRLGASDVAFATTRPAGPAATMTIDLAGGWTVQTSGPIYDSGIFGAVTPRRQLVAGILFTVLVAVLIFLLGTGRQRARRLVDQRTGQLRHQALHDSLTGLPNRALVVDRLEQLLLRARRQTTTGAAMFLDLDDFKNVNDTLGHAAGDQLLVAVAERLSSTLREADTIGRMGGDEFVVLIDGASLDAAPELVAERLLDVMRHPFELSAAPVPLTVGISIGIAAGDRASAEELLRDADVALYQSKAAGKNRYEMFHAEMQSKISRRIDLEFDLRSALLDEQFQLVYQPIHDLGDLSILGVEALLRWNHPRLGVISPEEFIPILEQTGAIREVGRWVLDEACRQVADWHSRGHGLDLSVNVSGRQLDHDGLVEDIRRALDDSGLSAQSLIIEITETALMHNADDAAQRLHRIKDMGVRISVDDFGTGYSSLAYLRRFPADYLKIDRMFTSAISTSAESKALIATLVQLGQGLGLKTLAEGVETADELDFLRLARVDEAQGFLFAQPLSPAALEALLGESALAAAGVGPDPKPG